MNDLTLLENPREYYRVQALFQCIGVLIRSVCSLQLSIIPRVKGDSRLSPSFGKVMFSCSCFKTGNIYYEAVAHITLEHTLVSLIDFMDRDHLYIGQHAMLRTEIEHFLGLPNTSNERP